MLLREVAGAKGETENVDLRFVFVIVFFLGDKFVFVFVFVCVCARLRDGNVCACLRGHKRFYPPGMLADDHERLQ